MFNCFQIFIFFFPLSTPPPHPSKPFPGLNNRVVLEGKVGVKTPWTEVVLPGPRWFQQSSVLARWMLLMEENTIIIRTDWYADFFHDVEQASFAIILQHHCPHVCIYTYINIHNQTTSTTVTVLLFDWDRNDTLEWNTFRCWIDVCVNCKCF